MGLLPYVHERMKLNIIMLNVHMQYANPKHNAIIQNEPSPNVTA